MATKCVVKKSL